MHKIVIYYNYNTYFQRYKIEMNYYLNAMRDNYSEMSPT